MPAAVGAAWRYPEPLDENEATELWAAVDRLVDRAPTLEDLLSHRLDLFAARRWRASGRPVPAELIERERRAAVGALVVPLVFERIRSAYDGDVIPMKGPVLAARYPDPALRAFGDLDLLVEDPAEAQAKLIAGGFEEVDDPSQFQDIHHLRPLWWPGLPLGVELHSRPNWPIDLPSPPTSRILAAAVPVADGVKMLPPAYHALLVAAHSWRHGPLSQLRDMIDVVAMAEAAGRDNISALAREWGVERLWRSTIRAADAAVLGAEWPTGLRLWARNLERVRERTVFENHATRWLSDFWIMPPRAALARLPETLAQELSPAQRRALASQAHANGAGNPQRFGQALRPRRSDAAPLAQDARLDVGRGFRKREHVPCAVTPSPGHRRREQQQPRGLRSRRQDEKDGCTG